MKNEIVLVYRKQFPNTFSIEFVFDQLKKSLQPSYRIGKYILPKYSNTVLNRLSNLVAMLLLRHKIVHVTGDVHYVILGLWFCKRILTIHDLAFMHQNKGIKRSILKWFYIILPVKFAHRVTVVSEATKVDLLKYININPAKITVIPNFISDTFQPDFHRNFNKNNPQILQIGTAFNKNIHRLAEAIQDISCTLIIVGKLDESQIKSLKKYNINYLNKINLTAEELHLEYKTADLLTFISTIEGFGLPILEAQATGLPVITSNCSAMLEVAGDGAFFVDPFEVSTIRREILTSIENDSHRENIVKRGFGNVKRFSKEKIVAQYETLYQQLQS